MKPSELASELASSTKVELSASIDRYGLMQLYAAGNCGASELNAGAHGAYYESPRKNPVESNRQQRRAPICRRQSLRDDLDI